MSAAKNTASKAESKTASFKPHTVVVGDGWGALASVGFLVNEQKPVLWIANTGARMFSALPSLENGPAIELWQRLARTFGIEPGEPGTGSFLRELRNKAFREPAWMKAPTPEAREEVMKETLWAPEQRLAPLWEARFQLSLSEIEQKIRALLLGNPEEGGHPLIRRIEEVPIGGFKIENDRIQGITMGSGEEILCDSVIYADRWDALPRVQGLPKNMPFIRGHEPASILQAIFGHEQPIGAGLPEGFFAGLHRESGEEFERHAWGHFSSDGNQSFWTLCLTGDEVEDNHQIAKKLRRLKTALDKMFIGSTWLPEGKADFMSNVAGETVHFHESVVFGAGKRSDKPAKLPAIDGLQFITDGFGPSSALIQAAHALGLPEAQLEIGPLGSDAQAKDMDFASPEAP